MAEAVVDFERIVAPNRPHTYDGGFEQWPPANILYYRWDQDFGGWVVVSDPLEEYETGWVALPENNVLRF